MLRKIFLVSLLAETLFLAGFSLGSWGTLPVAAQISAQPVSPQLSPAGPPNLPVQPQTSLLEATATISTYLPVILKSGSVIPTPVPTSTPPTTDKFFSIGPGSTDVIPHQLVRTNDDRLYIFVSQQYSPIIRAYWTTAAGFPATAAAFAGSTQITESSNPLSVEAVYDGGNIIHVLVNNNGGVLKDHPFDITSNAFKPALSIASGNPTVAGAYIGTSGVSGMVDTTGNLHIAYWSSGNHITHRAYTYNSSTNVLTLVSGPTQVDSSGSANHPAVAISPLDNSLTVAWVSEATNPKKILAKTRTSAGVWGSIETASTAPVWTSTSAGINIDQGPSVVISSDGTKHLAYIENYDGSGDYGRIHYVSNNGSGWADQALTAYTHDPALALRSSGDIYIIGHGFPLNSACLDMRDMCTIKKNSNGTWGTPVLFAAHSGSNSFDASPSVKWSVVGFNQPEVIEFLFFGIINGDYDHPTVYYARIGN